MLFHIKKKLKINLFQYLYEVLQMSLPSVIIWRIQLAQLRNQIAVYQLYMLTMLAIKNIIAGEAHVVGDCVHLV